jgi:tRNA pseudouridine38-40 synthase
MATYRLTLEYDGAGFHGWQRQPGARTVEGELREALRRLGCSEPVITAASRTDAGVHAHGQSAGLTTARDWEPEALRRALCALLPEDVTVSALSVAPDAFHARHDAVARTYRYLVVPRRAPIARRYAWEISHPLDLSAMRRAAALIRGCHDFGAFGRAPNPGGSTQRTVHHVSVRRVSGLGGGERFSAVVIEVSADAFLHGMMRGIAGALVAIGRGQRDMSWLGEALTISDRSLSRITAAPARGLHQWLVTYP